MAHFPDCVEGRAGGEVLADMRTTFRTTARHMGQLFRIDSLHTTSLADGSTSIVMRVSLHPDSMRRAYPAFAAYLDRYVMPSIYRMQVTDAQGARYLDLTGTERLYRDEPLGATARRIREAVLAETRLSVSIGGGTSKLVAKLAATLAKPGGVHVFPAGEEPAWMRRFQLADLPYVGPRFQERQQVNLLQQISRQPQVDNSFMTLHYDEDKQWQFGVEAITRMGFDWQRSRQDKTLHPFTTSFGWGDVRITTRVYPNYLASALFGLTLHEAGHAMYAMGSDKNLDRTPLFGGASSGIHESQSRMWENLVGRSFPFWQYFYPRLQELFPSQLGNVSLEAFYKGINKVQPSFIRVEADEATYNLHIMLRMELEIALLEGKLQVKDLPEAWNSRFQEYLGITPPDNTKGVLQDVHWSGGMLGYSPPIRSRPGIL